jgi:thiamine biosynthesis lipoprotein
MSILASSLLQRLTLSMVGILLLALSSGCGKDLPAQNFRLLTFGTYMDLELIGVDRQTAEAVREQLQKDFDVMHRIWHAWEPGPVGRINRAIEEGRRMAAPPSVIPLLSVSQKLAAQSDYLFDPGIGQLVKLWGFHSDELLPHQPPDKDAIESLLAQQPSIRDITLEGFHLSSGNPAVSLDFGAIGKGYGVDQAIQRLREMGVKSAIVNAGGDLRAIGSRAGNPWRIAVRDPVGGGIFALISVTGNEAVFTSGDYQRNFAWEGKFYHHIIDPRTGYPAEGTSSVTVLHQDATTADAAATALFIAGPDNWHRIARQMGIGYVLLIDKEGAVHMNPAMQKRVELQQPVDKLVISEPL